MEKYEDKIYSLGEAVTGQTQAHIILKSGTYNFSALTEAEIAGAGAYVDPDLLKQGEFFCL